MIEDPEYTDKVTLIDRIAVGLLSAFMAVITYGVFWVIFARGAEVAILPIGGFYLFAGVFFLLGFITLDNYVIDILAPIWNFIVKFVR